MTNAVRAMGLGTWVNPIGYLGVQGTQASYFLKSKHHQHFPVIMRLVYSILFSLVIPKESYFLLFLNLRKRFIRTWIVQSYS